MIRKLFWTILLLTGICVATSLLDRRRAKHSWQHTITPSVPS